MTNGRAEVITSVERRWRWSSAEKEQLVAASLERCGRNSPIGSAA
jgi:transposase